MALFGGEVWVGGVEERFEGIDFGFPELLLFALGVGEKFESGGFIASVGILGLVEDREETEVFLLGDGVIFVAMALGASHGEAHPDGHGRVDAIDHGNVAKFFVVGSSFVVGQGIAVKGGGDELIGSGIGEEITGELVTGEAVEGGILIPVSDDPIAIGPDGAGGVIGITGGVGVAGEIEPFLSPVFAEGGGGEESIDELFVGEWRGIGEEGIDFGECGRKSGQIEGESSDEARSIGFG